MTHPTKAICPLLLVGVVAFDLHGFTRYASVSSLINKLNLILQEDFRKVAVERQGSTTMFNSAQIQACMAKVTALGLYECVTVGDIFIKVYYAGHVLGAAMFYVRVGNESIVYTVSVLLLLT